MLNGLSPRINKDMIFQASQNKNPLKVVLPEGHIFKTLASVAFSVVGGTGFEPATSTV
jgi:hypothetical protein